MAKKAYIGVENFVKRDLPTEYTQVEYIQFSGTQYVNTEFAPTYTTRVVARFDVQSSKGWLFGCRDTASSASAGQYGVLIDSTTNVRFDYFGTSKTMTVSTTQGIVDVDKNGASINFNGTTETNTTVTSGACAQKLWLFSLNNVGNAGSYLTGKLYFCQIYDNSALVRDFVPCINSSGVVGLYDFVDGVFYTNAGTGSFTAGATYGSVAKEAKHIYIGINGIARKVKKAYVGVNGIARLFYQAGVEWTKYSCTRTSSTSYTKEATPSGGATTRTLYNDQAYAAPSSYSFSSSQGYYTDDTSTWYGDSMVGFYDVSPTVVQRYASVQSSSTDGGYTQYNMTTVASAIKSTSYSYSKGNTNYGAITADEGSLPEDGTLVKGSATGSYCVLLINGTYYYYEKV